MLLIKTLVMAFLMNSALVMTESPSSSHTARISPQHADTSWPLDIYFTCSEWPTVQSSPLTPRACLPWWTGPSASGSAPQSLYCHCRPQVGHHICKCGVNCCAINSLSNTLKIHISLDSGVCMLLELMACTAASYSLKCTVGDAFTG